MIGISFLCVKDAADEETIAAASSRWWSFVGFSSFLGESHVLFVLFLKDTGFGGVQDGWLLGDGRV